MLTLKQLLTPMTEEQALDLSLDILDSVGFNATSWQSGSIARTLVQGFSRVWADTSVTAATIAEGIFNKTASGPWLDLVSDSFFENERGAPSNTIGKFRFVSSLAAPTHTKAAGDVIIADQPNSNGDTPNTYRNVSGFTLNPGDDVLIDVVAEVAGSNANIPNNSSLYDWTGLVGVTVTNPAIPTTASWITTFGADAEGDPALRERNSGKLQTLEYSTTEGAYRYWTLNAIPGLVTRLNVLSGTHEPGSVEIVCATDTGTISTPQADAIKDYLNGVTDGRGRRPLNDIVYVTPAVLGTITIKPTVVVQSSYVTDIESKVEEVIKGYFNSLPIGGIIVPPYSTGKILIAEMIQRIMALDGVLNVQIYNASNALIVSDLNAATNTVYTATVTSTIVPVVV